MTTLAVNRIKLSVFLERYFPDPESRPCPNTLKNHIRMNILSGRKIGGAWYVECTPWGEPLHYGEAANEESITVISTGNKRADVILNNIGR